MTDKKSCDVDPFSTIEEETITENNEKNKQIEYNGRINITGMDIFSPVITQPSKKDSTKRIKKTRMMRKKRGK